MLVIDRSMDIDIGIATASCLRRVALKLVRLVQDQDGSLSLEWGGAACSGRSTLFWVFPVSGWRLFIAS